MTYLFATRNSQLETRIQQSGMISQLRQQLDRSRLPRHVAIIMDGNGRWAQRQGYTRIRGHQEGAASVREIVRVSRDLRLPYLTLYAFSEENWQRPQLEVQALMQLLSRYLKQEVSRDAGKTDSFSSHRGSVATASESAAAVAETAAATAPEAVLTLTLALSYGSRSELVRAARLLGEQVQKARSSPRISPMKFFASSFTPKTCPIRIS